MSDALPPSDENAEAGALGCVLLDPTTAAECLKQLTLDDFYDHRHRLIFATLQNLHFEGKEINAVTLAQRLRDKGQENDAGGVTYFLGLPDCAPSVANFPTFLEAIRDRTIRRSAIRDAAEVSAVAFDTSLPTATIAGAARRLAEAYAQSDRASAKLTVRSPVEILEMNFDDSDLILGDRLLATGQSLVIAGAGSIGKSRLELQLAVATIAGRPFVSLETRGQDRRWLILQAENSNRRLQADLEALRRWVGADAWGRVCERLLLHTLESDCDGFLSLGDPATQRRLASAIADTRPDIVTFDSLYNFAIGDLNTDADMGETLLTLSRITKAGNPNRAIVVLHHALTGKAGAAKANGYDRASFGRNSKVLHSWTRGQINVAPGSPDSNDTLVLTCGKCSNGKEFAPFAVRLNADLIYEPTEFDFSAWQAEVSGKSERAPAMPPERVRELCELGMTKAQLAKAISDDCGCYRGSAYRYIARATGKTIHYQKGNDTYCRK